MYLARIKNCASYTIKKLAVDLGKVGGFFMLWFFDIYVIESQFNIEWFKNVF